VHRAVLHRYGATWQRCKVHFLRNALAHARKDQRQMVLAAINTAFGQDSFESASQQWRVVADQLRGKFPKLADLMDSAEADVLAFMSFPKAQRSDYDEAYTKWVMPRSLGVCRLIPVSRFKQVSTTCGNMIRQAGSGLGSADLLQTLPTALLGWRRQAMCQVGEAARSPGSIHPAIFGCLGETV
jgi:hypothetical protein